MPFSGTGPGKTGPKLVKDFVVFDPKRAGHRTNCLTDFTPPIDDRLPDTGEGGCRHEYTTKTQQSVTPPLDLRPDDRTEFKVAAICKKCTLHADISTSFTYASNVCPNAAYPLHHFQRVRNLDTGDNERIVYNWQCSSRDCHALLTITYRIPRLDGKCKDLLTNTQLLKTRYKEAVEQNPDREGMRQATPIEVVSRLRRYISDALKPEHERRTFPANNKRFIEAFGVEGRDCAEMLQNFGFKYTHPKDEDEESGRWTLPQPDVIQDRLRSDGTSRREVLEDVEYELLSWMFKIAAETGVNNPAADEGWPSADQDIERTLAAQGYHRCALSRRTPPSKEQALHFASLGVLPDFADSLVVFAYDRQTLCDPGHRPYYLECLQTITDSRNTEPLQMKVATEHSQEVVSTRDLRAAYKALHVSAAEAESADDERILNLFQVLLSDSGPEAQENARQALYQIGKSRGSQKLMNASRETMETYEDALSWLGNGGYGVDKDTGDESILAVVAVKTQESKKDEEMARKAVSIIAKERKSNTLNNWLLTGSSDEYLMTPEEALRHLNVGDDFNSIQPDLFPTIFQTARITSPGDQTEKAIAALEKAIAGVTTSHPPETWPVGLTSHGNTCYLNSLLQYYFSIKPLRDIVLNYDDYKLDTTKYEVKIERVGQRQISKVEIEGGQRFAADLKQLFQRMIKDPREHVKPEEDLVCRAFLEPKDYNLLAKEEKADPIPQANGVDNAVDEKLTNDIDKSEASSVTLQESPNVELVDTPMMDGELPLTPPASPGLDGLSEKPEAPAAPPLPPRRVSVSQQALQKAQDNARMQQDVTEVHDSIMFRLRSGIRPLGKDTRDEQEDALRNLFKIGLVETAFTGGEDGKKAELFDSTIQLDVPSEPTDIYSAMDAYFDFQAQDQGSESSAPEIYKSIRSLPPVLQISIPRIGFDKVANATFKSTHCVKLEEELYLDRYFDAANPSILPKRKECWGWRKQLQALRKEEKTLSTTATDLDGPDAIIEGAKYLSMLPEVNMDLESVGIEGIDIAPELPAALSADATVMRARLDVLKTMVDDLNDKLKEQFADSKKLKYRLAAVFIHRGNYGHGHYWIYIHDFGKNMWRSYNDEKVEEFKKVNEILEANLWDHGTPTYAVYVRDEDKMNFIQPVCRDPEKLPTPEPSEHSSSAWQQDVSMGNGDSQANQTWSSTGIDPKLTVTEGGSRSWDEKRVLPNAPWIESNNSPPSCQPSSAAARLQVTVEEVAASPEMDPQSDDGMTGLEVDADFIAELSIAG